MNSDTSLHWVPLWSPELYYLQSKRGGRLTALFLNQTSSQGGKHNFRRARSIRVTRLWQMAGLSTTRHLAKSTVPPPQGHGRTEASPSLIYEGNLHLPNWFISLSRHLQLEFLLKAVVRSDDRIRCSSTEGLPVYTSLKAGLSSLMQAVVVVVVCGWVEGSGDTMLLWFF